MLWWLSLVGWKILTMFDHFGWLNLILLRPGDEVVHLVSINLQ
jgi:hypothetical protein